MSISERVMQLSAELVTIRTQKITQDAYITLLEEKLDMARRAGASLAKREQDIAGEIGLQSGGKATHPSGDNLSQVLGSMFKQGGVQEGTTSLTDE